MITDQSISPPTAACDWLLQRLLYLPAEKVTTQIAAAKQHLPALNISRSHNRMMRKGKRKSATVYLAAAVILTCYLAQTIDCYRLKKTERREGRKEADAAKTIGVREGKILFGRVFDKGSGLESQVIDGTKKSPNASVEDEAAYQADFAGRNLLRLLTVLGCKRSVNFLSVDRQ